MKRQRATKRKQKAMQKHKYLDTEKNNETDGIITPENMNGTYHKKQMNQVTKIGQKIATAKAKLITSLIIIRKIQYIK